MASTTHPTRPRSNSTHAYAIVTTSSSLLTRSNSTNVKLPQHSYTPISQTASANGPPTVPRRNDYYRRRGHRPTKSMGSVYRAPPSLPPPPPSPLTESASKNSQLSMSTSEDDINLAQGRNVIRSRPGFRRAETLPSFPSSKVFEPIVERPVRHLHFFPLTKGLNIHRPILTCGLLWTFHRT